MIQKLRFTLLFVSALLAFVQLSTAQHFRMDSTFRTNGIDTFGGSVPGGIIHRPTWVIPQHDNKILLAGYSLNSATIELMRLKNDGSYDSTFNDSGIVRVTRSYTNEGPNAILVYDTSKVMTASSWLDINNGGFQYVSLTNFKSNGQLNTGFGNGGVAHVAIRSQGIAVYCRPVGLGRQTDGKFIVYGGTKDITGYFTYGLTRLKPDGVVDSTYGLNGTKMCPYPKLATPYIASWNYANAPVCGYMQPDNKFVAAGWFDDSTNIYAGSQTFVVRHNMDGTADMSFGEQNGITILKTVNCSYEIAAIGNDSAGNYYVYGSYYHNSPPYTDSNFTVMKLDHNGHRVLSYGYNGVAYLQLDAANRFSKGFAVQKDGKVLISNIYRVYSPVFADQFVVYRLDASGKLDTSFNTGGMFIAQRPAHNNDFCVNTAVDKNGNILMVGSDSLSATSVCMRITNRTNGVVTNSIVEIESGLSAILYPNPTHSRSFHLRYTNTSSAKHAMLSIYDQAGRIIDMHGVYLDKGQGDVEYKLPENTPAGIYNISLDNGAGRSHVYKLTVF